MPDIVMPRLSDSMEEGTILTWLKQVGEQVAVGEELVEIETDKANMAYEADVAGTLTEILAQEGETLAIGSPIARIGGGDSDGQGPGAQAAGPAVEDDSSSSQAAGEEPSSTPPAAGAVESAAQGRAAPAEGGRVEASLARGERVKASPLARRLAKERRLDLASVQGSGPGGRIVKSDVESAVSPGGDAVLGDPRRAEGAERPSTVGVSTAAGPAGGTAKGDVTLQEPTKLQQTVARRMAESKATAPHFYLSTEVEMGAAVAARSRLKKIAGEGEVVPSFNDMVVKASAIALREMPKANGAYRDGRFELYSRVNVGVAVAAQEALVVPTVFDADHKGLRQIATDTRALAAKVRDGSITPPELSGATFTVSNLGMFGVDRFDAVINSPQAAILAVGAIKETPVVKDGEIVPGHLMGLNLACDHRILYGAEGAELLARIRALLEEPLALAL
jgi:pyruvate dehydrogenase E2 component (dihydrolipoamide acetyltransferase)